jgi:hypothetical protein
METKIPRLAGIFAIAFLLFSTAFAQAASTAVTSVGKSVTMKASADGTAPFTYTWQVVPAGSSVAKTLTPTAADPSTLVISNVQLTDSGVYTCTVKNSAGQAVGTANLTINPASPTTVTIIITIS